MIEVIKKKPIGRSYKILLFLIIAGAILIPLVPLAVRGSWVYTGSPEFCVSCHMMKAEYSNWSHSAHRNWAGCGDCHLPQQSVVTKFTGKTRDGLYHGYAYVFKKDSLIRISKHGNETVMDNCIRCHEQLIANIQKSGRKCWECHRGLPHGY